VTVHCAAVADRCRSRWIVVTEMETIVKSIITIAMAGTSGHSTLHRWYLGATGGEPNGVVRRTTPEFGSILNLCTRPGVEIARTSPSGGGQMGRGSRMRKLGVVTVIATLALGVSVAQAGGGTVKGSNFRFAPKTLTITKGSKVTWSWVNGAHTVTFVKGSFNKALNSAHQRVSRTLKNPGTYKYYCRFHRSLGMTGKIVVN
jgi:plastocyanin